MSRHAVDYEVHQEEDLLPAPPLVRVYFASIAVGAVGVFFAGVILAASTGALQPSFAGPRGPQPAPLEISHVEQTLVRDARRGLDLRDAQRRELETWGWVDRRAGIARIPIEQAIDVVLQENGP